MGSQHRNFFYIHSQQSCSSLVRPAAGWLPSRSRNNLPNCSRRVSLPLPLCFQHPEVPRPKSPQHLPSTSEKYAFPGVCSSITTATAEAGMLMSLQVRFLQTTPCCNNDDHFSLRKSLFQSCCHQCFCRLLCSVHPVTRNSHLSSADSGWERDSKCCFLYHPTPSSVSTLVSPSSKVAHKV